jgi:hypothetical protein
MTQFRRPNGETRTVAVDRPPEIERMAQELIEGGFGFECEVLRNGMVAFEVVGNENDEGDPLVLAHQFAPTKEWVTAAVDQLVRDAHEAMRIIRTPIQA